MFSVSHFSEAKNEKSPAEARLFSQEKETRKTLRFANSHARVAKRQFRAAYQNRKIRFVRPRSGDTNSAKPKKNILLSHISTYGYIAKRSVLRTAMRVSRSGSFARRIKIGKYGLFGREAATQTRRSRKRHLIIAYFNVWVQTSQRNKLSSDLSICGYKSVFEYITRKAPPKRGFSLKRKKYEKNTNKQYNIRSAVIRGDIFAEGQRNGLLFSVSDDRYGDRVPYLVAVNDRIVIRH